MFIKDKDGLLCCLALVAGVFGCGTTTPGPAGQPGPAGATGATGPVEPTLSALLPSSAFLARAAEVQISGSGTHFDENSVVDFGDPQITVAETRSGGEGQLRLQIQIGATARFGAHDVTVTSGTESATLTGAFSVQAALQAEPVSQQPMIPQGGIYPYNLRNLDYRENPFSGSPTLSGFSIVSSSAGAARVEGVAMIDALTPAGALAISATSKHPFGADVLYSTAATDMNLARVVARTPSTLTNNTARTGDSLSAPYASNLYKFTTTAASQLLILTYSGLGSALTSGTQKIVTAVAPASGKFSQGVRLPWTYDATAMNGILLTELATVGDYFFASSMLDYSGAAAGYTYTITPKVSSLTQLSNPEPGAETPANPSLRINTLTGAIVASDGKLVTNSDNDYLVFTAANTGTAILQVTNNFVSDTFLIPVGVQLYSDADCSTMMGGMLNVTTPPATVQVAVTSGQTYCARFSIAFPTTETIPYKILLSP